MYKNKRIVVLLLLGTVLSSCIEINGSGYSILSDEDKKHVIICNQPLDSLTNNGNLYAINTKQVKEYLQNKHRVIVYEYLPFCSGESGTNPQTIYEICKQKAMDLLVVSSVYDGILPISQNIEFPIFVIDFNPYHTDNYQKYSEEFYKCLTNDDSEDRKYSSYHLFEEGKYIKSLSNLGE